MTMRLRTPVSGPLRTSPAQRRCFGWRSRYPDVDAVRKSAARARTGMAWPRLRADGCGHYRRGGILRAGPGTGVEHRSRSRRGQPDRLGSLRLHRVDAAQGTGATRCGVGAHARRTAPVTGFRRRLERSPVGYLRSAFRCRGPCSGRLRPAALPESLAAAAPADLSRSPRWLDAGGPDADRGDRHPAMGWCPRVVLVAHPDSGHAAQRRHQLRRQRGPGTLRRGTPGASRDAAPADHGPGPDCDHADHGGGLGRRYRGCGVGRHADAFRP